MEIRDMDVKRLGFGLMRLPKSEDGSIDVEHVKQMVDMYIEAGGNYFDTARGYPGSEDAIRQALVERYPRDSFYLATKNPAWAGCKDADEAKGLFELSLEATGTDYIDFYLLHNIGGNRKRAFDDFGMWDFVKELKEQGRVKHIGFSHHDNADVLDQILAEHPEMEFVQLQVNYADWNNDSIQSRKCVEVANRYGKPIVVMEPVHGGQLANPPEAVAQILREANPDATFASWALRFAMGVEGVLTVLSGMSDTEQMRENIELLRSFEPLGDDELAVLERAQAKLAEVVEVPCTACHYCMPDCPQDINISGILDCVNRAAMYDVQAGYGQYRFETLSGIKASDCIRCGQCEDACPQSLPIIEKLEKAATLFD